MISDITGNPAAKTMLLMASAGARHGTSYMITGEPGTGKNFAAIEFAKALNCLKPGEDGDCCDECANCRLIDRTLGQLDDSGMQQYPHPDALYINTVKAQLGIDLVRDKLNEMNSYRTVQLKKKIVIINDAERLTRDASNSILKELEEPNESVVIMLIVNNTEKILPTIISRCRKIEIKRASYGEIEEKLRDIAEYDGEEELKEAVVFSEGRIGDALNYEEQKENINFVSSIFSVVAGKKDDVEGIFGAISKIEAAKKEKEQGYRMFLADVLKIFAFMYRDLLNEKYDVKKALREKYAIEPSAVRDYSAVQIMKILRMTERAQRDLMANANTSILFNNLFFSVRKEGLNND